MARQPRKHLATAVRVLFSTGVASAVIWFVSPGKLIATASSLDWRQLALATAALVVGLFLADSWCVRWLYDGPGQPLAFRSALEARGASYLFSSFNYELGQGAMAWHLARDQGRSLVSALALCGILAYHDVVVLLGLGLFGASQQVASGELTAVWFCGLGLVIVVSTGLAVKTLPWDWLVRRFFPKLYLGLEAWKWRHSLQLCLYRLAYYSIILCYAAVGLRLCGVDLTLQIVCSIIPLVLLADGLPVSVSGLGTREVTLLLLLNPAEEQRGIILAFSLMWSLGLGLGRLAIGLAYWWFLPARDIGPASLDGQLP